MEIAEYTLPIRNLINEAQAVHLFLTENPTLDSISTILAWCNELEAREKKVFLAAAKINPQQFNHLPNAEKIQTPLPQPEMRILVDLRPARVSRVNYETDNQTLIFHLYPQNKPLSPNQVQIEQNQLGTDLIIAFGFKNEGLLKHYRNHNLVNIDFQSENTRFGKINLIDTQAVALSEISTRLFSELNWSITSQSATLLLAGLISATQGFRQGVKPQTFQTAALLTESGADVTLAHEQSKVLATNNL